MTRTIFARIVAMTILSATAMQAQESRATITGTVADPQGAVVPGATVAAKNLATNGESKTTTNQAGLYVIPFLSTGNYTVTVTAAGFKTAVQERAELGLGERRQLDFTLEVGGLAEQVMVRAEGELLSTANAIGGTVIDIEDFEAKAGFERLQDTGEVVMKDGQAFFFLVGFLQVRPSLL